MTKPVHLMGQACTGHGCFPPRASVEGEPRFTVGGVPIHLQGQAWSAHGCPDCAPHASTLTSGAARLTVGGLQLARIGDPVACGSTVAEGEPRFTVGD